MRVLTLILLFIAFALIGYNATLIDFNAPFEGDSEVALILILASLCAITLLVILILSKKIQEKLKKGTE